MMKVGELEAGLRSGERGEGGQGSREWQGSLRCVAAKWCTVSLRVAWAVCGGSGCVQVQRRPRERSGDPDKIYL